MNWKKWIPRVLLGRRDGGPDSHVRAFGFEWKAIGSVLALRFAPGSRDAYHSHAFDAWSWVAGPGWLREVVVSRGLAFRYRAYHPGALVHTPRECTHRVISKGVTWVLTVRGPCVDQWIDHPIGAPPRTLTHGRREVTP